MAETITTIENTILRVIESRIDTEWRAAGRSAVQYPMVMGLKGTDGLITNAPPTNAIWLKADIVPGETTEATFSQDCSMNRNTGVIQLAVYVPANQGTVTLATYKGYARAIFSRYVGNGLRCRASNWGPNLTDAGWIVGIVTTAFEFYESMT